MNRPRALTQSTSQILVLCVFVAVSVPWNIASAQEDLRSAPRETARALPLPSRISTEAEPHTLKPKSPGSSNLLATVITLGVIVGALLLAGRWLKRSGFQGTPHLPIEAFELLGRRSLDPKVAVHLVRCGSRILLISVAPDGARTLAEIDDPAEVDRLLAACQQPSKADGASPSSSQARSGEARTTTSTLAQRVFTGLVTVGLCFATSFPAYAQGTRPSAAGQRVREKIDQGSTGRQGVVQPAVLEQATPVVSEPASIVSPQQLGLSLKMLALMTVLSLAPSILMMTTCFVRFIVVLGLLRQALGTQQGPPNQVLTAICLFLTFLVMSPIWQKCYQEGIRPYTNPAPGESTIDEATAITRTIAPVRGFMSQQIDKTGNAEAVWMLLDFQRPAPDSASAASWHEPESYDDVPFTVLAPAYLLSELKVGFLIGFQLFLPFLVIDLVVATTLTSVGLTMLPPSMVSLPLKLLLFVLIDGWFLTVGMLLESVRLA